MMGPWILWMLFLSWIAPVSLKCFEHIPDVNPKRHFYYDGKSLPIKIESSDRISHQLTSHILRILLEEILGYNKTEIHQDPSYNSRNISDILNRLGGCHKMGCILPPRDEPKTMVNLEMWVPAGFNMQPWIKSGYIVDAGPLGPTGRFGWFMSTEDVEKNWMESKMIIDHWKALRLESVAQQFSVEDEMEFVQNFLTLDEPEYDNSLCRSEECENGILTGHECNRPQRKCALLLSSYEELDMGVLRKQINNLGLQVSIAPIGSHLPSFIYDRQRKHLPALFFNWEPNTLTALGNFTRVKFPSCRTPLSQPVDCDYEVHQLSKVMWIRLQTHTPEAYHLITHMQFTQKQYEDLLRVHDDINQFKHSDSSLEEAACAWLLQNKPIWQSWIPKNLSDKTRVYIGGMFPITGPFLRQPGIVPGAQMALDFVNADPSILPHYELVMLMQDTQCKADIVMKQFMYLIVNDTHPIAGILGPGCSETAEPVAAVSKHFNTIVISYSAESVRLADRRTYPLFFRTAPQMKLHGIVYTDIFLRFGWKQVALLAEDTQEFPEYHSFLEERFLSHGVNVVYQRKMPQHKTSTEAYKMHIVQYIEAIRKKNVHIIILTSLEYTARAVMCEAYRQKMTGHHGYQWFLPVWFTYHWWDTDFFNAMDGYFIENVSCSTEEMKQAIEGHIYMSSAVFGQDDSVITGNITVLDWKEKYWRRLRRLGGINKSPYATYAYDAVWVFALGLHQLLSEDPSALESLHTDATTQKFMQQLNSTHFNGASGPVQFVGADRNGIINIHQYLAEDHKVLIGQYLPDRAESEQTVLNESQIMWLTGEKVVDGRIEPSLCSVEFLRKLLGVSCNMAIVFANVIGVGTFALFMVIALIIVKKRYDAKVRATRERMQELGLLSNTSWLCLDQWEVSREHVVLNRKLGEGAFGTVYGGEALIDEQWVAVAVKTLKIGSNPEEKLDFLSEAEMMKRFDHENIVKLLGVCTRGEPAYTIMEFMLHGDLKTFLLARRHLVGTDSKEAEDIRDENLSRMALDVAYGLQYLTELKYVHRDLACRNCLVHASKRVKIGDFGMTRPMYDSDYYRFSKRGMLPVRWMAPESLMDGLFTPMSDMWSLGILLFEIVTFGSFPYQGLSNKQVLEHVRKGQSVAVPNNCSAELKALLKSCWAVNPEGRPTVNDIVAILSCNPTFLFPCLDAPLSAVNVDGMEPADGMESVEVAMLNNRQSVTSHRIRSVLRTSSASEHTQLHNSLSQEGPLGHIGQVSPSSLFGPNDPFVGLSSTAVEPEELRQRLNSETAASVGNHTETVSASASASEGEDDCDMEAETPCIHMDINHKCIHSKNLVNSPESPIQMRYIAIPTSIEEKGMDSDYCSDYSKDFWNVNGTSLV